MSGHIGANELCNRLCAPTTELSQTPMISVIMTSYNTERWVEAAVSSVLQQTWRNLELLAIDDQSTDGTLEKLQQLQSTDPRVRVLLMKRNGGTYAARNVAMELAMGEVITFMDSDDQSQCSRLELQLAALRSPGTVASTCNYERRDEDGRLVMNRGLAARQALISLMFKRKVIEEIGWFDSVRVGADDEYFERLRTAYGRAAHRNVDQTLYSALWRAGSLANNSVDGTHIASGVGDFLSPARQRYKDAFSTWHHALQARGEVPYVPPRNQARPFRY